ncbi:MAG: DUF58 domain-containing protein [Gammaproteobacteria bacterium]|nr:DUF58 domain-containing protein [Gammaproteobacteria bacterium]
MIFPARALLAWLAAWLALALAVSLLPGYTAAWFVAGAVLAVVALVDAVLVRWLPLPTAQRHVTDSLPLAVWSGVELQLSSARWLRAVELYDHAPADCETTGLPARFDLQRNAIRQLRYRLRPIARGDHSFGPIELRVPSPLRLWRRRARLPAAHTVCVYPNFAALTRRALLAADAHTPASGILKRRRRGEGIDFEQLREYRQGDSLRQIDWKATRRIGKLISREYQDERDQRIVLLVDCGRRMGARDGQLSHFDHALDSVLLLGYVGLRQGDAVGLMTLGGHDRYLAPHKSRAMVSRILHTVYDLQPTLTVTDFEAAAASLVQRLRRRALVVIFTNLRDEDDASLISAVQLLAPRHLVLVASLREQVLDETQRMPVETARDGALRAAAVEYRRLRDVTAARLRQAGVMCLDVPPHELAIATVNRYLAIKAEGRL